MHLAYSYKTKTKSIQIFILCWAAEQQQNWQAASIVVSNMGSGWGGTEWNLDIQQTTWSFPVSMQYV